jgi:hypothetical protein
MPKEYEYTEGKKARENFESGMKTLFKVPKDAVPAKKKARKKRAERRTKKASGRAPYRDSGDEA